MHAYAARPVRQARTCWLGATPDAAACSVIRLPVRMLSFTAAAPIIPADCGAWQPATYGLRMSTSWTAGCSKRWATSDACLHRTPPMANHDRRGGIFISRVYVVSPSGMQARRIHLCHMPQVGHQLIDAYAAATGLPLLRRHIQGASNHTVRLETADMAKLAACLPSCVAQGPFNTTSQLALQHQKGDVTISTCRQWRTQRQRAMRWRTLLRSWLMHSSASQ